MNVNNNMPGYKFFLNRFDRKSGCNLGEKVFILCYRKHYFKEVMVYVDRYDK
jgi:hypothetical protein